jgi:hypothetical protein
VHARRNDEIHVTDFGRFDGAAWLGCAEGGDWLFGIMAQTPQAGPKILA